MGNQYSLNFKLMAITMSNERGSIASVAHQLNIKVDTLKFWRCQYKKGKLVSLPKYSLDFKLKAITMSHEMGSIKTVAKVLDIKTCTLNSWRWKYWKGFFTSELPLREEKYGLDLRLKAITLSDKRGSINIIAKQLGIPVSTLKRWRTGYWRARFTGDSYWLKDKKKYSLDFKLNAITMSNEKNSIDTVSQQLGISRSLLLSWRVGYVNGKLTGKPHPFEGIKKYSLAFKLDAIAMSNNWRSTSATCQQLGITKNNLKYWKTRYNNGLLGEGIPILPKKHNLNFKLNAIAIYNNNGSYDATIQQLGISKNNLRYWIMEYRRGKLTGMPSIVKSRKRYNLEFKQKAIAMSKEEDGINTTIQQLNISKSLLNSWRLDSFKGRITGIPLMVKSKRKYSLEFKLKAIAMSLELHNCKATCKQLNINNSTLMYWRTGYRKGKYTEKNLLPEKRKEIKLLDLYKESVKLKKEIKQLASEQEILNKISQYPPFQNSKEKYLFVIQNADTFQIKEMCNILKIRANSYYAWLKNVPSQKALRREMLLQEIQKIYNQHKGRYGSKRITKELQMAGIATSQFLVTKLMRSANLICIPKKKFKITTDSAHQYLVAENRLTPKYIAVRENEVWVSDITYIRINPSGWLYLTIILDLFDRKVIGWSLSHTLKAKDTIMEAFKRAVTSRPVKNDFPLIFHSDRGVQYACHEFISELKRHKSILQSMSRKGACWENAVAESFFSSLKKELVYQTTYNSKEEAQQSIIDYIENYYNTNRRHSGLNNLTITEFHELSGL